MKKFESTNCNFSEFTLNKKNLYSLMGYGSSIPNNELLSIIDDVLIQLTKRVTPRYNYVLLTGETIGQKYLKLEELLFSPGLIITHAMKNAEYYVVFTATLGELFDCYCKQLKEEKDIVRVFIADSIGSILVESVVTLMLERLKQEASTELMQISNNYSPGYCDWVLTEQKKLFQLFPKDSTGITLTDSCLMVPIKSISGLVAIGREVVKRAYGCAICNVPGCIKNRKKSMSNS